MEVICLRFPSVADKILENVDNHTLVNFKESSKGIYNFINGERFYWFRILQTKCQMDGLFSEYWKKTCKKTPVEVVKKLAMASIKLSKDFIDNKIRDWSPFHLAAGFGNLELYKWIEEKVGELQLLQNSKQTTPLHLSAYHGRLEIFKHLVKKSSDKNPKNKFDVTPLHLAATNGHFDICKLLITNASDKNPRDTNGRTPLHAAAFGNFLDICKFLVYNIIDKNPNDDNMLTPLCMAYSAGHFRICKFIIENADNNDPIHVGGPPLGHGGMGRTLLHQAAKDGNLKVYQAIIENVADKNPKDYYFWTPFHLAALYGHTNLCSFISDYLRKNS